MLVRNEGDGSARLRIVPGHRHSNLLNNVNGGAILALIDAALFAGAMVAAGPELMGSVTLDLATQFIGTGKLGEPLDVATQVLKETGRLVFMRGLVEQGEHLVASFSGTLRKPGQT